MPKRKILVGKTRFVDLAVGYWCIVDERYKKWRVEDMPHSLQKEGISLSAEVEVLDDGPSIFMSGKAVRILSWELVNHLKKT